ncbi:disulfide bond formation protein B [Pseudomonas aeruginosa]|nr:disulfide bond formation protein B [Pseudomonas aeruginosa]
MLAASLGGIYHAWSLVAEEKLAAQGMGSCKMFMGFPEWIPLDSWLPQVFQPEGLCGEVVWTLLGQSMAVWSLALFVFCLLVLAAKLAFGRRTA